MTSRNESEPDRDGVVVSSVRGLCGYLLAVCPPPTTMAQYVSRLYDVTEDVNEAVRDEAMRMGLRYYDKPTVPIFTTTRHGELKTLPRARLEYWDEAVYARTPDGRWLDVTRSARAARHNRLAECERYTIGTQPDERDRAVKLATEGVTMDLRRCVYIVRESRDEALAPGSHYLLGKVGRRHPPDRQVEPPDGLPFDV